MNKELFDYIKNNILRGMPSGNLVTKNLVDFNIELWQNKSYDSSINIRGSLRRKWCSKTINIFYIDDICSDNIIQFLKENDFSLLGRDSYFVYCIAFKTELLNNELKLEFVRSIFPMSKYSNNIIFNEYYIAINDFIKNILFM